MSEPDCLKLTTYFGERDRAGRRLLADALLDLYGEHELQTSILLRGTHGFGRRHHLHTDRLLSLSEDLPVVSVAVDRRARIEALLDPVRSIVRRGLITLERARLLSGESGEVGSGSGAGAAKLTVYLGRGERVGRVPAAVAVCELLHRRGLAGATVLLGVDGTRRGRRTRARLLGSNGAVPMMVITVGDGAAIARILPELRAMLTQPLLTLERVRVCKRDGVLLERPPALPERDERGRAMWQKLMVFTSQSDTHGGRALDREIVRRLRGGSAAGATSLRGIWGFHGDHAPHGDRLLQLRRRVPVVTIAIDAPERIAQTFAIVDELTAERGLVTSEMVPALTAPHTDRRIGGLRLASHDA